MNGEQFIQFAERIASDAAVAARRSAISRAYYGALHECIALLKEIGVPVDTRHDNAAIDFKCGSLNDAVMLGRLLDELRHSRVAADYQLADDANASSELARYAVAKALEALQLLASLRQQFAHDSNKQTMLQHIREARQKTGRRV